MSATAVTSYEVPQDAIAQGVNEMGMRVMQARVWQKRNSKNILLKSPPASGKSRALMYLALDKMANQGVKKVIAAVPEKSIGSSFQSTDLKSSGFFADWHVEPQNNLVADDGAGDEKSKVDAFLRFIKSDERGALVCTHSTLRAAFKLLEPEAFEDCLVAIDEFHHLSVAQDNRIGHVVTMLLGNMRTHVLGMTGSYFRGDANAVMLPEHESLFNVVTFTYYEQLQGYSYLKKINIGHHFYPAVKGSEDAAPYIAGIRDVYKPGKKTIIHLPQPNSKESVDKYAEFNAITDIIGEFIGTDEKTGLLKYKCRHTGNTVHVANFVDEGKERSFCMSAMRHPDVLAMVDVVVAVRMAMEGFDWPAAEMAITIGARSSLTQIVQIIGRVTRDYPGKTESTFINLLQEPVADQERVETAVNDILKAISASLLMEQVISPKFDFKSKTGNKEDSAAGPGLLEISIEGFVPTSSERVKGILEQGLGDLVAEVLNSVSSGIMTPEVARLLSNEASGADYLNRVLIPKVIAKKFGDDELSDDEHESLRQQIMLDLNVPMIRREAEEQKKKGEKSDLEPKGDKKSESSCRGIIDAARALNVGDLTLDMIAEVNPFLGAYEVVAHSITEGLLKLVRDHIRAHRRGMTAEEAASMYPELKRFIHEQGRTPDINSTSDRERQLAEARQVLIAERAKRQQQAAQ